MTPAESGAEVSDLKIHCTCTPFGGSVQVKCLGCQINEAWDRTKAQAVAEETARCLAAVAEVRERSEYGRALVPGLPNIEILTRGALSALQGVERLIKRDQS